MGITAEKRAWMLAHVDYDGEACLFWPWNVDTAARDYFNFRGVATWSPARLMCTLAHGPQPPGKRFALAACAGKNDGCIHPKHLRWMDGAERAKINRTILDQ